MPEFRSKTADAQADIEEINKAKMPDQAKFPQEKIALLSPFPLLRSQFVSRNETKMGKRRTKDY
jgi:hypothetical protein